MLCRLRKIRRVKNKFNEIKREDVSSTDTKGWKNTFFKNEILEYIEVFTDRKYLLALYTVHRYFLTWILCQCYQCITSIIMSILFLTLVVVCLHHKSLTQASNFGCFSTTATYKPDGKFDVAKQNCWYDGPDAANSNPNSQWCCVKNRNYGRSLQIEFFSRCAATTLVHREMMTGVSWKIVQFHWIGLQKKTQLVVVTVL